MTDITERIRQASASLREVWAKYGDSEEFWAAANEVQEAMGEGVPPEDEFVVVEAMQAILHSIGAISDDDMRGFVQPAAGVSLPGPRGRMAQRGYAESARCWPGQYAEGRGETSLIQGCLTQSYVNIYALWAGVAYPVAETVAASFPAM